MADPAIRPIRDADADAVTAIYNHYIAASIATFEEAAITPAEIRRRVTEVAGHRLPWLVVERDGTIMGYAYATPWKERVSYRYSVESTIYLAPDQVGHGVGTILYAELLRLLRAREIHVIIGGISLPNAASVRLHEKLGMHQVARFEAVGFKFGRWIDVGYWQVTLD